MAAGGSKGTVSGYDGFPSIAASHRSHKSSTGVGAITPDTTRKIDSARKMAHPDRDLKSELSKMLGSVSPDFSLTKNPVKVQFHRLENFE